MSFPNLKIDDYISSKIINNTHIFKNINPNIITCFGLLLNYLIYKELYKSKINFTKLFLILALRCLSDILDGSVARKYKKISKIGGLLDTLSDSILQFIVADYFIRKFRLPFYCYGIVLAIILASIFFSDSWYKHTNLKTYEHNKLNLSPFLVNNTCIWFIIFSIVVLYLGKKRH